MQPDPASGMHCWHQKVTVEPAHADDRYADVFVDTAKSRAVYEEWKKLTRPAKGPLRRPPSATGSDFDPQRSDVDLIVQFEEKTREKLVDAYFGLKEQLEVLFGCPVDLLTAAPVRNPYLRESIERSRQTLYAA